MFLFIFVFASPLQFSVDAILRWCISLVFVIALFDSVSMKLGYIYIYTHIYIYIFNSCECKGFDYKSIVLGREAIILSSVNIKYTSENLERRPSQ